MILVTAEQMKLCDEQAMHAIGIPGAVLMENAGRGCVSLIEQILDDVVDRSIVVLAGKGNNGGDGFVIARYLLERGADVITYLIGSLNDVKGDAAIYLRILQNIGHTVTALDSLTDLELPESSVLVIDALIGTGQKGAARGLIADVIESVNDSFLPVLAIDAPSGIAIDTGAVPGVAIRAGWTATLATPKPGLLLPPAKSHVGDLHVIDIGMPYQILEQSGSVLYEVEEDAIFDLLPNRPTDAHKGMCGTVSVIAGSLGMTGAASLATAATLRSGAGKTILGIPKTLHASVGGLLPEVMTTLFDDAEQGYLGDNACAALVAFAALGEVHLLGPGLGRHDATGILIRELVPQLSQPVVIDADALFALEGNLDILAHVQVDCVITPHIGEFATLLGMRNDEVLADRLNLASTFAVTHGVTVVLKAHPTVIALPNARLYINGTGNAGMATAGSGDVLTGVIAGLMAQGISGADAALAGTWIHGMAGDLAAKEQGKIGMIATDILTHIPIALKYFE